MSTELQAINNLLGQIAGVGLNHINEILGSVVGQLFGNLNTSLNGLLGNLQGLLGKRGVHIQSIITQVQQAMGQLTNLQGNLQTTVQNILGQFQQVAQNFLTSLNKPQARSALLAATAQAKGDISAAFNSLLAEALSQLQSIATSLANVGLASVLGALQGKRGLLESFGDIINSINATLGGHLQNITSSLLTVGSNLVTAVGPHIQDLQDQLINHGLNAAQSLLGTLSNISTTLQGKRGIFDDLLSSVTQALGSLGSSLQQTGTQLVGAVLPHLQDLQDQLINHGLNAAQSLLGTLAGISGTLSG